MILPTAGRVCSLEEGSVQEILSNSDVRAVLLAMKLQPSSLLLRRVGLHRNDSLLVVEGEGLWYGWVFGFGGFFVPGVEVLVAANLLSENKGIYSSISTSAGLVCVQPQPCPPRRAII